MGDKKNNERKILSEDEIIPFFDVLKANVDRTKMKMTIVFVKVLLDSSIDMKKKNETHEQLTQFLFSQLRNTDLLYTLLEPLEWGIILIMSGEEETKAFVKRLYRIAQKEDTVLSFRGRLTFQTIMVEIANDKLTYGELIAQKVHIFENKRLPWGAVSVKKYNKRPFETVKVSILENNDIFRDVLKLKLQNIVIDNIQLDIQTFTDGYDFLESDWYYSGHLHVVIMNDILPRKNGLEVLHILRRMANNRKFIIYMMTNRNSQADMITAYENGVDVYLVKPFDLRLFEAELKRTFERLWI